MLILNQQIQEEIEAHGKLAYPHEGCGLLLGQAQDDGNLVTVVRPLANVWPVEDEKPERFRIAEEDWRDVELEVMSEGLDVVGIFHSHPDHPPVASPRDLAWASWPGYSYLITQISDGRPAASRSWQLAADRSGFVEEEIKIINLQ
jgi:proteasome lid subunit RPN8/RPN11